MDKSSWQKLQKSEIQYHLGKDQDQLLDLNIRYWSSLLEISKTHAPITAHTRILDVGCGCCGLLLAIERGILVGLDPLMDQYLMHFDFLRNAKPLWVSGTAEEMNFPQPFDIIFSINSLDHGYDTGRAAGKFDECLRPGGHLIVSLNCHNTDFFYKYYSRFYRFIDRYHPHHFRPKDVINLFPDFRVITVEDIDHLFLKRRKQYREKVLHKKGFDPNKAIGYLINPLKYPVALARFLGGLQVHRKKADHKAIFSTYLFIFQKPR